MMKVSQGNVYCRHAFVMIRMIVLWDLVNDKIKGTEVASAFFFVRIAIKTKAWKQTTNNIQNSLYQTNEKKLSLLKGGLTLSFSSDICINLSCVIQYYTSVFVYLLCKRNQYISLILSLILFISKCLLTVVHDFIFWILPDCRKNSLQNVKTSDVLSILYKGIYTLYKGIYTLYKGIYTLYKGIYTLYKGIYTLYKSV